jgi:multisubunit Na+/H+ antiporter MnhG subunit
VSAQSVVADALLACAAALVLACTIGVLVMRDVYQKLHFLTPISIVAPILVAGAITVREGWAAPTGQSWLAVAIVCVASPVLGHATVRAARIRERGDWRDRTDVTRGRAKR